MSQDPDVWAGVRVGPGEQKTLRLPMSISYTGADVHIPVQVWRGAQDGPTVMVCAAVHGDEINGTGTIRHVITDQPFQLTSGVLVLVPVVNILGFERHSRYLPDRRDLNRCFPGRQGGSLSSRMARSFFEQIVQRCDYAIDLHTAAVRRTNFPNIRADMSEPRTADFARAFGAELLVSSLGPKGSLRRAALASGCATIVFEAGEVWKVEPVVVEHSLRGIRNCLVHLGMVEGKVLVPKHRIEVIRTQWIRAALGGFLQFHVSPGAVVKKGTPLATNTSLTGEEKRILKATRSGVVLGMTTLPAVAPGDPICNLALTDGPHVSGSKLERGALFLKAREDLARNVVVTDPTLT